MRILQKALKALLLSSLTAFFIVFGFASEKKQEIGKAEIMENHVRELRKELEEVRGLRFKKTIQITYRSRQEMASYVREQMQREATPEERKGENKALVEFGFIQREVDLEDSLVDFYTKQALGFYDIERSSLVLITDILSDKDLFADPDISEANTVLYENFGIDLADFALLHELDHALIDQNFPLKILKKSVENDFDKTLSYLAFIEGEAMLANHIFIFQRLGIGKEALRKKISFDNISGQQFTFGFVEDTSDFPEYITSVILFPYKRGLDFISEIFLKRGWAGIDALYSHPPVSTEHILHPQKHLLGEDPPREVILARLEPIIGPQWKDIDQNTLGEFRIQLLISYLLKKDDTALIASEGWGGDRYMLLEDEKNRRLLYFKSLWDSERDAQEFYDAYQRGLKGSFYMEDPSQTVEGTIRNEKTLKKDKIEIFIRKDGDSVEILKGPGALISKIREALYEREESSIRR